MEFGVQLRLNPKYLDQIGVDYHRVSERIIKILQVWLDNSPNPTVKQILLALRSPSVHENVIADDYERFCKTCKGKEMLCNTAY